MIPPVCEKSLASLTVSTCTDRMASRPTVDFRSSASAMNSTWQVRHVALSCGRETSSEWSLIFCSRTVSASAAAIFSSPTTHIRIVAEEGSVGHSVNLAKLKRKAGLDREDIAPRPDSSPRAASIAGASTSAMAIARLATPNTSGTEDPAPTSSECPSQPDADAPRDWVACSTSWRRRTRRGHRRGGSDRSPSRTAGGEPPFRVGVGARVGVDLSCSSRPTWKTARSSVGRGGPARTPSATATASAARSRLSWRRRDPGL